MKLAFLPNMRRRLLGLALAALIALGAAYAPVALDVMAHTTLTSAAFACGAPPGGC